MVRKLNGLLAIYRGECPRCNDGKDLLYVPELEDDKEYPLSNKPYAGTEYHAWNFLCEDCMNELGLEIDIEATRKYLSDPSLNK